MTLHVSVNRAKATSIANNVEQSLDMTCRSVAKDKLTEKSMVQTTVLNLHECTVVLADRLETRCQHLSDNVLLIRR